MSTGFGPKGYWDQRFAAKSLCMGSRPTISSGSTQLGSPRPGSLPRGEGRNAVFLAELGHQVCAQDISPIGLGKAKALAQRKGVNITTLCCDLRRSISSQQPRSDRSDLDARGA